MEKLNKEIIKNKEVIIFDLDGTLINTINIWNKVDYLVLKKYNIKLSKTIIQDIRDNYLVNNTEDNIYLKYSKYLVEKYNLNIDYESFYKERITISNKLLKDIKPKQFVLKTLNELKRKNYLLILATSTTNNEIELYKNNKYMKKLFYYFDLIVTANSVKNKKPNPEIYEYILKKIRLNKNKFIVVEDSHIGLLCASNIGIDKIYLENKYSKKDYDLINRITEYKLNNFLDLYKIIKKI